MKKICFCFLLLKIILVDLEESLETGDYNSPQSPFIVHVWNNKGQCSSVSFCSFFFFFLDHALRHMGISVSQPGIESQAPCFGSMTLNPWATSEVSILFHFSSDGVDIFSGLPSLPPLLYFTVLASSLCQGKVFIIS